MQRSKARIFQLFSFALFSYSPSKQVQRSFYEFNFQKYYATCLVLSFVNLFWTKTKQ